MELTWNARCQESIKKQRKETEQKYGIQIDQTNIYCLRCRKPWDYGNKELHIHKKCSLKDDVRTKKSRLKGIL